MQPWRYCLRFGAPVQFGQRHRSYCEGPKWKNGQELDSPVRLEWFFQDRTEPICDSDLGQVRDFCYRSYKGNRKVILRCLVLFQVEGSESRTFHVFRWRIARYNLHKHNDLQRKPPSETAQPYYNKLGFFLNRD